MAKGTKLAPVGVRNRAKKLGIKVRTLKGKPRSKEVLEAAISRKQKSTKGMISKAAQKRKSIVKMTVAERKIAARSLGQAGGKKTAKVMQKRKNRTASSKKKGFWGRSL